jgi:hypothetical protein
MHVSWPRADATAALLFVVGSVAGGHAGGSLVQADFDVSESVFPLRPPRRYCTFHPLMEHHASRWGPFHGSGSIASDDTDFPNRQFLPDTLEHIS